MKNKVNHSRTPNEAWYWLKHILHMWAIMEQDQPSYSHSLIPRPSPTSSFDHLQYVNQMMALYPGPILPKHLGTITLFPTIAASSISQYQNTVVRVLELNLTTQDFW